MPAKTPLYSLNDLSDDVFLSILSYIEPRCSFNIPNEDDFPRVQFTDITIKSRTKPIPVLSILSAVCSKWRKIVLSLPFWETFDWVPLMSSADYASPSKYDRFFESLSAVPERIERIKTVVIRVSYLRYPGYSRTLLKILANSSHFEVRIVLREADELNQSEWDQSIKDRVSSVIPEIRKYASIAKMFELRVDFAYMEGRDMDIAFAFIETEILSRLECIKMENCLDVQSLVKFISSIRQPILWKTLTLKSVGLTKAAQPVLTKLISSPLLRNLECLIVDYAWFERQVVDTRTKLPLPDLVQDLASRMLEGHPNLRNLKLESFYGYDRDFLETILLKFNLETLTIVHEARGTVWHENPVEDIEAKKPDFKEHLNWLCEEEEYLQSLGIQCHFEAVKKHIREAEFRFDNGRQSPQGPVEVFNDENWIFDF